MAFFFKSGYLLFIFSNIFCDSFFFLALVVFFMCKFVPAKFVLAFEESLVKTGKCERDSNVKWCDCSASQCEMVKCHFNFSRIFPQF